MYGECLLCPLYHLLTGLIGVFFFFQRATRWGAGRQPLPCNHFLTITIPDFPGCPKLPGLPFFPLGPLLSPGPRTPIGPGSHGGPTGHTLSCDLQYLEGISCSNCLVISWRTSCILMVAEVAFETCLRFLDFVLVLESSDSSNKAKGKAN